MKVLAITNFDAGLFKLRYELLYRLSREQHELHISTPPGEFIEPLQDVGVVHRTKNLGRRSVSPVRELFLLWEYASLMRTLRPDVVMTWTSKPNIYGGIAGGILGVPHIANVTGLGTSVHEGSMLSKLVILLYRMALHRTATIHFQNAHNHDLFCRNGIIKGETRILPGSGVNLDYHSLQTYPSEYAIIKLLYIGRIMRDKGVRELFESAQYLHQRYQNVEFHVAGFCEESDDYGLHDLHARGVIVYHGLQHDIRPLIRDAHAVVLPSYHEGTSNALLEAAANGRPVVASNVPGCMETFDEGVSGFGFEARSAESLTAALEKFLHLPHVQKEAMGLAGRRKMEAEYDRDHVVDIQVADIERFGKKR